MTWLLWICMETKDQSAKKEKVIMVIRDGWGERQSKENNAIMQVNTPVDDVLREKYPSTLIDASGNAVGLPTGYQGNSEVGHMTIGSGRIIFQPFERINKSIEEGSFFENKAFTDAIKNCKDNSSKLHIAGLLQVEGVHSHKDHLFALIDLCRQQDFRDVYFHIFTDGRDSPVNASISHLESLKEKLSETGIGEIATISGRFYAMDRDKRWDRTKKAYDCVVLGNCETEFEDALSAVKESHNKDITDEFIVPMKKQGFGGINNKDSFIFFNFRTDRPRQLTKALVEDEFDGFERENKNLFYVGMTQYYRPMNGRVAFEDVSFTNLLGDVIADNGLKQLRISETEKYAHVTFFFNGQKEEPSEGEDRILVPSPKVETYDKSPEMSVNEITQKLVEQINTEKYDLIVTNLVNCDMVGHTGDVDAIEKAIKAVDSATGKIVDSGLSHGYTILIFADHGNAEDQSLEWKTSHTMNKVPFIIVSDDMKGSVLKEDSGLSDVAPTVLTLMGLSVPSEMTGKSIVEK